MSFLLRNIFCVATLLLALAPLGNAQQVSARQVAGLMEDVAALRNEVQRLRVELEDLRAENARILDRVERSKSAGAGDAVALATLKVDFNRKLAEQKREITSETDKKIDQLGKEMNKAIQTLIRQVNSALKSGATPSGPVARPKDLPEKAISYKIKPGDTLSKIAAQNRSKINWILFANEGLEPNRLAIGSEIFVPQAD